MSTDRINQTLTQAIEQLSAGDSLQGIFHQHREGDPLPSSKALGEIIELSRTILFPGYFGKSTVNSQTIKYHIGVNIERLHKLLTDQIMAGLCFNRCDCNVLDSDQEQCRTAAKSLATLLIERFPKIRKILATDVEAAYNGDPAAESFGEIISCYPVIKALTNYRVAHELVELGVPVEIESNS